MRERTVEETHILQPLYRNLDPALHVVEAAADWCRCGGHLQGAEASPGRRPRPLHHGPVPAVLPTPGLTLHSWPPDPGLRTIAGVTVPVFRRWIIYKYLGQTEPKVDLDYFYLIRFFMGYCDAWAQLWSLLSFSNIFSFPWDIFSVSGSMMMHLSPIVIGVSVRNILSFSSQET